jgi:hypothetical protein
MLGNGPLESLASKLPDARKKRFGGLRLDCPLDSWLDDISKDLSFPKNQNIFQALIVMKNLIFKR